MFLNKFIVGQKAGFLSRYGRGKVGWVDCGMTG